MKNVLITGATSGIGLSCVKKLSFKRVCLVLCARNEKKLEKIKYSLRKSNASIFIYKVDVRNKESVELMFKDLHKKQKVIDVLINNAGLALDLSNIKDSNSEDWDVMIDTNVKGLLYVTQKFLQQLKKNGMGHIINIGSIAGIYAYPKGAVYSATKSAVKFISDGLRKETSDRNIKVTNIQPGLVETNFSKTRFFGDVQKAKDVYDGIKPLSPDDIADLILYILTRPRHVQICEVTITPLYQAAVDVISRKNASSR